MEFKEGEKFLVVTDPDRRRIGEALFEAGTELGAEAALVIMLPREANGEEPPGHLAAAMVAADVVVVPTTHSLTHTRARQQVVEGGARVATMPGITEDMFREGAITADYAEVERHGLQEGAGRGRGACQVGGCGCSEEKLAGILQPGALREGGSDLRETEYGVKSPH